MREADLDAMPQLIDLALNDERVVAELTSAGWGAALRMLNYVLPVEFYISEIPMFIPEGEVTGHGWPEIRNPDHYRIVFTRAEGRPGAPPSGIDILKRAINKHPIVEVHIDAGRGIVLSVLGPPERAFYAGMPVPLY